MGDKLLIESWFPKATTVCGLVSCNEPIWKHFDG